MTGARQTMLTWAKVIDAFEAIPTIYQKTYQALVGNTSVMPYTVLAPAQGNLRDRKSAERLLCEVGDTFYVLERAGTQVTMTGYPYAEIGSLELGNILLYSWFSIHGKTNTGSAAVATVEFNEACLRHFEPFFRKMRPAPAGSDPIEFKLEQAKLDYLTNENFKFMNFARESLVAGEKIIQSLYQPQNRQSMIRLFGHSLYRTLSLAHLTILTDQEIILIGDAERITENKRSRYGGVWHYLPLRKVASVALDEQPNNLLRLTFYVLPDIQLERLYDASHLQKVEKLKQGVEALLG
jgi:hypothetical protein